MSELALDPSNIIEEEERPWPPTLWNWGQALIIIALFFVGFIIVNVAQVVVIALESGGLEAFETGELTISLSAQVVTFIGLAIAGIGSVAAVNAFGPKHSLERFGFRRVETRWLWIAVGLGLGLAVVRIGIAAGLLALVPGLAEGLEQLNAFILPELDPIAFIVTIILTSLLVPLWEEVFFRGFLHNWFRNRMGMWPAILLSSALFGAFHLIPLQVVLAFLLGLGLAWVYEQSESLWPVILLHVANNLFAVGLGALSMALGLG